MMALLEAGQSHFPLRVWGGFYDNDFRPVLFSKYSTSWRRPCREYLRRTNPYKFLFLHTGDRGAYRLAPGPLCKGGM